MLVVLGCEPRFVPTPLPELAAAREPRAIAVRELRLDPGETMIWDVSMRGFTIGRAEVVVAASDVRSVFRTGGLASSIASVTHELVTGLDRATASAASQTETLVVDGATTRVDATFDRSSYTSAGRVVALPGPAHTLHTALGVIRAWAGPPPPAGPHPPGPGFLFVLHAGRVFRVDLAQPADESFQGARTIRVDGRIRPVDGATEPIGLTLWLSANHTRAPLRIEIRTEVAQLTAELVASE